MASFRRMRHLCCVMPLSFIRIKETCLYVKDLNRTKQFYHGKLGLEVIGFVKDRHIFFRAGESVLLCFISDSTKTEDTLPSHHGSGNLHFAFETTKKQYEAWKAKIKSEGIEIEQEAKWGELKSFYFRDPDGHLVEIAMEGIWG
ncbi:MAG TPA: VOC family protein [Chitinophagales bacterium]|nr:VOC family protein [Chitinophagales bacterium]